MIGAAALFLVNACQKPVVNPPELKLQTTEFADVSAAGDVVSVPYTLTNGVEGSEISVEPVRDYDWAEVTAIKSSAIEVTVLKNETTEPRTADFTVTYPGVTKDLSFSITQAAGEAPAVTATVSIDPSSAEAPAEGVTDGMFLYAISPEGLSGDDLTCAVGYAEGDAGDWVTCEEGDLNGDGAISYSVDPNEGGARTAYITLSYPNADDVVFTIDQAAAGASAGYDHEYVVEAFLGDEYSYTPEDGEDGADNYFFAMSEKPLTPDGGYEDGSAYFVWDIYAASGSAAVLPAGQYVLADTELPNTFTPGNSYLLIIGTEDKVYFADGTITIGKDGDTYSFDADLVGTDGETYHVVYTGEMDFGGEDEPADEVNYDFEYSYLSFYKGGGEDGGDNFFLSLSDKPFDADGYEADGCNLANFDIYAAAGTDGVLPAGTYRFDDYNYKEGTFSTSSYIRTPEKEYIYFSDGSIDVAKSGDDYTFEATLTGRNDGKTYKVSYTGPIGDAGGDEDPSEVTFKISVDNLTYEGYTYSIIPSVKDLSYIHLGTPKDVLVEYGAMTEDGVLNEYVLHDDVISQFLTMYREQLVHTGDLTDAKALFPASSSQDVVVLCYGIDSHDNRITPVTTYEFTMPSMPAVITLDETIFEAPASGYGGTVYYSLGGDYDPEGTVTAEVESGVDWVHVTVNTDGGYIDFTVDPNTEFKSRTATISVSHPSVTEPAEITIRQDAAELVLTENPNWEISYYGKTVYSGEVFDAVSITASDNETYISPIFVSKADYDTKGLKTIVEEDHAAWESVINYYGGYYVWSDFLAYGSGAYVIEYLEDSSVEYYALIYGVDDEGNFTGHYAISDPFYPAEIEVDEGYGKWIGNWRIEDESGRGYDVTIAEGIAGATYSMTGWQQDDAVAAFGTSYPIPLTYDAVSGNLMFPAGQIGSYNDGYAYFLGTSAAGRLVTGSYEIASASLGADENTATVTPCEVPLADGSTFVPEMMQVLDLYYGSNWYIVSKQETVPVFPMTMKRTGSATTTSKALSVTAGNSAANGKDFRALRRIEPAKISKFSNR